MNLENAAAELSVLPPAEFVGRRGELAKEAKAAGAKEIAAEIKRLAKPSVAAWAVNLLATRRPSEFEKVAALGEAFRDAAASREPGALASLSAERRATLREATRSALDLAEAATDSDHKLSASVATDVEQTLQAVLADPAAAAAARTGRLVRALASTGVEAVDLTDAVGGPFVPPEPEDADETEAEAEDDAEGGASDTGAGAGADAKAVDGTERRADDEPAPLGHTSHPKRSGAAPAPATQAREAARDARHALDGIEQQLSELTGLRHRARDESDSLADEIAELESQLAELTDRLDERRSKLSDLEDRLDETDREYGRLDRQREKAARLVETTASAAERASDAPRKRAASPATPATKGTRS